MEDLKTKRNIKVFNGERYSVWKLRLRILLNEVDVIDIIDKDLPSEKDEKFKKADWIAKCVIVEYLSDSFIHYADTDSTAKEIL